MDKHYPHPIIAREGWSFIIALGVLFLLFLGLRWPFFALVSLIALAFVVQFFRDPPRVIPQDLDAVLSPADGRIVKIEKTNDPYLNREALKISVFMNVFNVHSNRIPVDGEVKAAWYNPGQFVNAALDKASLENERNALHIKRTDGQDITCVQVAGLIARRILCYVKANEGVKRGQRYGFIRFGSRVDVYLPPHATPNVSIGEIVSATETILARL